MLKFSIKSSFFLLLLFPFLSGCIGYNTIAKSEPINTSTSLINKKPVDGWAEIPVYDDEELFKKDYKVVAKLTVTGDQNSFDKKMIEKMQQEASKFNADAIIFKNWKEVERSAVNGLSIGVNLLSIINGGYMDLNMGGKYIAYQYEGIAIKFY